MPNKEFQVHILNAQGIAKAKTLAARFDVLLDDLIGANGTEPLASANPSRELSLVRTHLELASFYAKKAMASEAQNQESSK